MARFSLRAPSALILEGRGFLFHVIPSEIVAFKNVTQRTSWCFTSGHFYCFQNQSKSILQRNFGESLVSSSLRSQERRFEVRVG